MHSRFALIGCGVQRNTRAVCRCVKDLRKVGADLVLRLLETFGHNVNRKSGTMNSKRGSIGSGSVVAQESVNPFNS